uniref:Uncharacterized protein n=1 Tax=Astyanax mexicanus TaxID=7994 RepID=A0A3B1IQH6_ASTMX
TVTCMVTVPEFGGVPPSTAVRINDTSFSSSRSSSLSNTKLICFPSLLFELTFKIK